MPLTPEQLRGIIPPMVTPFTDEEDMNKKALRREINYLLDAGVHGLVAGGSTGEGAALTPEELQELCRITVEEVSLFLISAMVPSRSIMSLPPAATIVDPGSRVVTCCFPS